MLVINQMFDSRNVQYLIMLLIYVFMRFPIKCAAKVRHGRRRRSPGASDRAGPWVSDRAAAAAAVCPWKTRPNPRYTYRDHNYRPTTPWHPTNRVDDELVHYFEPNIWEVHRSLQFLPRRRNRHCVTPLGFRGWVPVCWWYRMIMIRLTWTIKSWCFIITPVFL